MTDQGDSEKLMPVERKFPADAVLPTWVIYERPKDYPEGCVLRAQWARRDGTIQADTIAWYASTVEELRTIVPPDKVCLQRHKDDDPSIVETWI